MTNLQEREIQNLREENSRLRRRFALLSELSNRISQSLDVQEVLQSVVDSACELTDAQYGAIGVFDAQGRILQFITHGITPEQRALLGEPPHGLGILGLLHEVQKPLRISDLGKHSHSVGFPPNHPPMHTFLGVPLRYGNDALGNLYLTEKKGGQEFTPEDETMVVLFAAQANLAIRNAQVHAEVQKHLQETQRLAQEAEAMHVVSQMAASRIDLDELLDGVLSLLTQVTGANLAEFWLYNPGEGTVDLKAHAGEVMDFAFSQRSFKVGEGIAGVVLAEGKPVILKNLQDNPAVVRRRLLEAGIQAFLAFPVLFKGAPVGVLGLGYRDVNRVDDRHSSLLQRIADELAPAIQNAELYSQVQKLAADLAAALQTAEQERARLEALVQSSPIGVLVADTQGNIVVMNTEGRRIFGHPFAQGEPENLVELRKNLTYSRADKTTYAVEDLPLQRALERGETVRAEELRIRFPDGHAIPTLVNATPLRGPDGAVTGAIATVQDITPLEELERLRNEFLGMVSHELKTPLTAIKGSAATVLGSRRPLDPEEIHELFEIINEQADRLRDLVDNLLDMTRIEVGSLSVNMEPVELQVIINDVLSNFHRTYELALDVEAPADLPRVQADKRRVGQVIWNLLTNAAKFSPATAPITLRVMPDESVVTIQVQDKGRGIPKEKVPQLFQKFSQVHDDPKVRSAGSGLGLAICKGIVEAHGGRIWVESGGEGQGATFSFTLQVSKQAPVVAAPAPTPDTAQRTAHIGRVSRAGERTRILAVDDDPQVLRYVRRTLDDAGYAVTSTNDPREVVKLVEAEEPDLVVLDLKMPGMTGFDILERIREFSGVPVIFLTAQGPGEDTVKALRMGADDYIAKPFSPSELVARIEASLRRRLLPDQSEVRAPLQLEDLAIDFAERRVSVAGKEVRLTATEYKLLYELATHQGQVLTHDQLLHRVWGPEYSGETDLVRSFIRNLRRKLGDDARNPRYVQTEPQVGYRMPRA